jgi:hypothetical protein
MSSGGTRASTLRHPEGVDHRGVRRVGCERFPRLGSFGIVQGMQSGSDDVCFVGVQRRGRVVLRVLDITGEVVPMPRMSACVEALCEVVEREQKSFTGGCRRFELGKGIEDRRPRRRLDDECNAVLVDAAASVGRQ